MFRTHLYEASKDPQRPEFYSSNQKGFYIPLDSKKKTWLSPGSKFWFIYHSYYWQPFRSILCRLLMIAYSGWLMVETSILFGEYLVFLNAAFLVLIALDGVLVVRLRHGLEDRWCSFSIVYFVCANAIPLWMLEIKLSTFAASNLFNPDYINHVEAHYRELTNVYHTNHSSLGVGLNKNKYLSMLGMHEALFCFVLISSRIFIPQATLTWSAISSQSEFAFNTIFDIYSTISLLRDARLNLPKYIWVVTFVVSNGALFPIALNIFPESSNDANELLTVSRLRYLTDNFYFRLIMQIVFADFPFLLLRLLILANLRYVRKEMYYLIAKQVIIIFCKLAVMVYDWSLNFLSKLAIDEIKRINNSNVKR